MTSTKAFPTSGDGELSAWVDKIRQSHHSTSADSSSNLEDEIRQSRLDRQKRRSRLSGAGVRGFKEEETQGSADGGYSYEAAADASPPADTTASREETLRRLMGDRPSPTSTQRPPSPVRGQSSPIAGAPSPRAAPLLSRYGGQSGPTGVASVSASGAPTSLASFMGGRAAGPRLGKLAGDGKSAPPEAALIDQSRHALPGMTRSTTNDSNSSRPLAAFLAARAGASSSSSPNMSVTSPLAGTSSYSATFGDKATTITSPESASSPALSPSFSSRAVPAWTRPETTAASATPFSQSPSDSLPRPASPVRTPSAPSPAAERVPSPSRYPRPQSPVKFERSASPVRSATSDLTSREASHDGPASAPDRTGVPSKVESLYSREIPTQQAQFSQPPGKPAFASIDSSNYVSDTGGVSARFGAAAVEERPASNPPTSPFGPRKVSPFSKNSIESSPPSSDKAPTASLTRLSAQRMVGQRIREAQARAQADAGSSPVSPSFRAGPNKIGVRDRWPEVPAPNLTSAAPAERKVWTPGKLGNALPGMSRSKSGEEVNAQIASSAPARSATIVATSGTEAEQYASPVRLPGLGGDVVPAAFRRQDRPPSPIKATGALPASGGEGKSEGEPLQHLAKGRARPPRRNMGSSGPFKSVAAVEQVQEPLPTSALAQQSPVRDAISGDKESEHSTSPGDAKAPSRPTSPVKRPLSPVKSLPPRTTSPVHAETPYVGPAHETQPRARSPVLPRPISPIRSEVPIQRSSSPTRHDAPSSSSEVRQVTAPSQEDDFKRAQQRIAVSIPALEALVEGRPVDTPQGSAFPGGSFSQASARQPTTSPVPSQRRLKSSLPEPRQIAYDHEALRAASTRPVLTAPYGTISLEVLVIASNGSTTAVPAKETHILYETEVQVILHRFKSTEGLVNTTLYVREGGRASADEGGVREKLEELATRFNSPLILGEPPELAMLLGGVLIAREGLRKMYEKGDTAMYRVRAENATLYIDQVVLASTSLCSAYSSIVAILGDVYVWYGRGATPAERSGALSYARTLSSTLVEQEEGDESELFWAFFDSPSYDSCVHYAHRAELGPEQTETALYVVDASAPFASRIVRTAASSAQIIVNLDLPMIVSGPSDVFVVVPAEARGDRDSISLALDAAQELTTILSPDSVFHSPIHVILFPSAIPSALRNAVRGKWGDDTTQRIRMNVLTLRSAREELRAREFAAQVVEDEEWLPCGVAPEDLE